MRVYVNLFVENRILCEVYPLKQNDCNEMKSVLKQAQDIRDMQDYIDAQSGGPGKGFFRIVTTPYEARKVINQGKIAVVQGMEVSEPFDCGLNNGFPTCDAEQIDFWLDKLDELGVRQLEITNKFDNALTGVAGDNGAPARSPTAATSSPPASSSTWGRARTPSTTITRRSPPTIRITTT